jgi:ribonuclease BN (tRNA processing enzyme)
MARWVIASMAMSLGLVLGGPPAVSAAPAPAALTFTTLGTNSGPIPRRDRSEPAALVRYGDQLILTDVGDGAAEQLAKAGVALDQVPTILISHLHFDHTGGLFGVLSLRFQSSVTTPLTIYGPPGTQEMVTHLFAAMKPGAAAVQTMRIGGGPEVGVKVVELKGGDAFTVGGVKVSTVENAHYATIKPGPDRPVSLSYRFDTPARAILYTGDTGPSDRVAELCKGVDLLVSEIMDPSLAIVHIRALRPGTPEALYKVVEDHFRREHLAPEEVGKLAAACGAKTVVATHIPLERQELAGAKAKVAAGFKGKIVFAEDLQTF